MSPSFHIVPLQETHVAALAELEKQCFADPWSVHALREELSNPCARFLVALCGDRVAGYIGCHLVAGEGFVTNVAVFPAYRRQGVARQLLQSAMALPLSRLFLEVRASNAAAIALYRSLGFSEDGRRPRFYSHPVEDAVLYSYNRS